ncbi:putative Ribosomal RNA-processing protein 8 [Blattamonas nauphoetae]|uniref:Ribosomal RNA-processing protein 8 n=1 Tax=Blattamonas nauphoetae TaxID=2049346 RepID=A0ABQ9YER9_9EUKA|nr:putative Ribosomal RNA-processing protein 8 [Blattamonas nauphoetae]
MTSVPPTITKTKRLHSTKLRKSSSSPSPPGDKLSSFASIAVGRKSDKDETRSSKSTKKARHPSSNDFQKRVEARLKGGKFRFINEQLYTVTGDAAKKSFKKDPSLFKTYHEGYREQVAQWPSNPLDIIIGELSTRKNLIIADMGCGEGRLAESCPDCTVHSFDLLRHKPFITVANLAKLPLEDQSVHIAVSCLSLMGVDWALFVQEAYRILKPGGLFRVAEVKSRIEDRQDFLDVFTRCGFVNKTYDDRNKMFVMCSFIKPKSGAVIPKLSDGEVLELSATMQPCIYKKR